MAEMMTDHEKACQAMLDFYASHDTLDTGMVSNFTPAAKVLELFDVKTARWPGDPKGLDVNNTYQFIEFPTLQDGEYDAAYARLYGYSSLGLENEPETAPGQRLYAALRQSYSYTLIGESTVDGMSARQQMQFRYLDVAALEADARTELENVIGSLSRDRAYDQVFDENNNYLAAFAREAYAQALDTVLSHAEDYYATSGVQLTLRSVDGSWCIVPDESLLKVLSGGLSY